MTTRTELETAEWTATLYWHCVTQRSGCDVTWP